MKGRLLTVSVVVVAVAVLLFPICWALFVPPPCGELSFVDGAQYPVPDGFPDIPQEVEEGASNVALDLCGNDPAAYNRVTEELLTVYSAARDKDILLVYNWGGMGRKFEELDREWGTVIDGVIAELEDMGYSVLLVQYRRTYDSLWDYVLEIRETAFYFPAKARPLAAEVDFLTEHIQGLRVIIAGNSEAGIYTNAVMELLEDNPRVYSLQCGTPYFYLDSEASRSLVMNDNGITPDTLSAGNFWAIIKANLTGPIKYRPEEGHLFFYIRAPGHIYTWDMPGVRSQVLDFIRSNFSNPE